MADDPTPGEAPTGPQTDDTTPPDSVAQEAQAKASRKRMLIGLGGTILVLVVVFWFIFTFVIAIRKSSSMPS